MVLCGWSAITLPLLLPAFHGEPSAGTAVPHLFPVETSSPVKAHRGPSLPASLWAPRDTCLYFSVPLNAGDSAQHLLLYSV